MSFKYISIRSIAILIVCLCYAVKTVFDIYIDILRVNESCNYSSYKCIFVP